MEVIDKLHHSLFTERKTPFSHPCLAINSSKSLRWRHSGRNCVSNHQPHDCLLNRLFRHRSKKSSKLRVTGLCAGNSPGPVNSPHKGPVTRKIFPFDDVIIIQITLSVRNLFQFLWSYSLAEFVLMSYLINLICKKCMSWYMLLVSDTLLNVRFQEQSTLNRFKVQRYGFLWFRIIFVDQMMSFHDDVIKWKHFPRYWPFVRGIHRSLVNSPHKSQWRGALMFSLICAWINGWVNNREAGDLRRHRAHNGITVMLNSWKCMERQSDIYSGISDISHSISDVSKYQKLVRDIKNHLEISEIEIVISKIELLISLNRLDISLIEFIISIIQLQISFIKYLVCI